MDRQEAVQKLARAGRLSIAHAEDLYDSFFPKPVVPQYVADWYEGHNDYFECELWAYLKDWDTQEKDDFYSWVDTADNSITTLVNMHQFGYEVEKEKRYTVKIKGVFGNTRYLNHEINGNWYINSRQETHRFRTAHTRKELEKADFGWVFDCPGVEVKEVTDE